MNFLNIQDETLSNRFNQGQRPNAKNWINYRYGRLWAMENWAFKYQVGTLSVAGGANSVARGTIGDVVKIWDSTIGPSYSPMLPLRPEDLWDVARTTQAGAAYDFTVVGDTIYFERPMDQNRTFYALSTIPFSPLVNDTDIPLIPAEFHEVLVSGATSHGLRLENDPAWQSFEQDWQAGIADMRAEYLTHMRTAFDTYPSWP